MKNVLDRNYNRLVNRTIARSYLKESTGSCPTCGKKKSKDEVKSIMKNIKSQFHG